VLAAGALDVDPAELADEDLSLDDEESFELELDESEPDPLLPEEPPRESLR